MSPSRSSEVRFPSSDTSCSDSSPSSTGTRTCPRSSTTSKRSVSVALNNPLANTPSMCRSMRQTSTGGGGASCSASSSSSMISHSVSSIVTLPPSSAPRAAVGRAETIAMAVSSAALYMGKPPCSA